MRRAEFAMAQLRYARNAPPTTRRRAALRRATANSKGLPQRQTGTGQRLHKIVDTAFVATPRQANTV